MNRTRLAGVVILAGGLLFGFAGGEYSTLDWRQLKRDVSLETAAIARLEHELDSLSAVAIGLERDPAVQERVARERFGMVRPGELLFRVESAMPERSP